MNLEALEATDLDMTDRRVPKEVNYADVDPHITPEDLAAWDKILDPLITADNNKFGALREGEVLVEVGKYEPPHRGHGLQMYAGAKKANLYAENAEDRKKFVVIVGSSKEKKPVYGSPEDQKYPFSFDERVELLKNMAKQLGLSDEVIAKNFVFIEIRDVNDNKRWVEKVIDEIENVRGLGTIGVVLANDIDTRRSTSTAFKENSKKRILITPFLNKGQNTGTKIRERNRGLGIFAEGGPHKVVKLVKSKS